MFTMTTTCAETTCVATAMTLAAGCMVMAGVLFMESSGGILWPTQPTKQLGGDGHPVDYHRITTHRLWSHANVLHTIQHAHASCPTHVDLAKTMRWSSELDADATFGGCNAPRRVDVPTHAPIHDMAWNTSRAVWSTHEIKGFTGFDGTGPVTATEILRWIHCPRVVHVTLDTTFRYPYDDDCFLYVNRYVVVADAFSEDMLPHVADRATWPDFLAHALGNAPPDVEDPWSILEPEELA